jgi:apolipoprotein D and lipocalin family protein
MRLPVFAATLLLAACTSQPDYCAAAAAPETVARVDLDRYAGSWHEIARYPNAFETGCAGVIATYGRRADGRIDVTNLCRLANDPEKVKVAKGRARVADPVSNAKLKVQFAPAWVPFAEGDYWILHLEPDYSAALVGDPSGKYLWILARAPELAPETLARIMARADALGYDSSRLVMTPP